MFKELLKDAFPIIEKIAPSIATALGGPMAGAVVQLLAKSFDGDVNNVPDIAKKILSDPQSEDKLSACNSMCNSYSGSLVTLWESLGRPISLNIEWEKQ